jgi:hypothetical protein
MRPYLQPRSTQCKRQLLYAEVPVLLFNGQTTPNRAKPSSPFLRNAQQRGEARGTRHGPQPGGPRPDATATATTSYHCYYHYYYYFYYYYYCCCYYLLLLPTSHTPHA